MFSADVVYVEEVEGGVTRLAAIFSSTLPPSVGPIRSARTTDIELLAQYGSVTLAYSGANAGVQEELERSGLRLLSDDLGAPGFARGPDGRRSTTSSVTRPPSWPCCRRRRSGTSASGSARRCRAERRSAP